MASSTAGPVTAQVAEEMILAGRGRPGMRVEGTLAFPEDVADPNLPSDLEVDVLDLRRCRGLTTLPRGLRCFELNLTGTKITSLPDDLVVRSILNLTDCDELAELPAGLKVGTIESSGCRSLENLPEGLDVWFLNMAGCWNFRGWPRRANIRSGRLGLRGCTALTSLPAYLGPLAALDVRDCSNLRTLPDDLVITGWIDIAHSGIAETKRLPPTLRGIDLRWQGVRIEERIVLRPETISPSEILEEANAERRRVLLDRFGISRFLAEAQAQVLDEDSDPGGPRQLLFLPLKDDEPLVTLSCYCPSTGKRYFLRVPPAVNSCRQAAAWIAGFDDPDEYQPILET